MNILKYLPYFFVSHSDSYTTKNTLHIYSDYFEKGGGFLIAFAVFIVVAFVFASLFYLYFGSKKSSLCSNKSWICCALLCCAFSFGGTYYSTGVTSLNNEKAGLWGIAEVYNNKPETDSPERKKDLRNMNNTLKKPLTNSKPIQALCLWNTIYALFLFLVLTWVFRKKVSDNNYAWPYPSFLPIKRNMKK